MDPKVAFVAAHHRPFLEFAISLAYLAVAFCSMEGSACFAEPVGMQQRSHESNRRLLRDEIQCETIPTLTRKTTRKTEVKGPSVGFINDGTS